MTNRIIRYCYVAIWNYKCQITHRTTPEERMYLSKSTHWWWVRSIVCYRWWDGPIRRRSITATVKREYTGENRNILPYNGPLTTIHSELLVQVFFTSNKSVTFPIDVALIHVRPVIRSSCVFEHLYTTCTLLYCFNEEWHNCFCDNMFYQWNYDFYHNVFDMF